MSTLKKIGLPLLTVMCFVSIQGIAKNLSQPPECVTLTIRDSIFSGGANLHINGVSCDGTSYKKDLFGTSQPFHDTHSYLKNSTLSLGDANTTYTKNLKQLVGLQNTGKIECSSKMPPAYNPMTCQYTGG